MFHSRVGPRARLVRRGRMCMLDLLGATTATLLAVTLSATEANAGCYRLDKIRGLLLACGQPVRGCGHVNGQPIRRRRRPDARRSVFGSRWPGVARGCVVNADERSRGAQGNSELRRKRGGRRIDFSFTFEVLVGGEAKRPRSAPSSHRSLRCEQPGPAVRRSKPTPPWPALDREIPSENPALSARVPASPLRSRKAGRAVELN